MEPSDFGLLSADGAEGTATREFSVAGLGDVDEVVLVVAEADNVSIDAGEVSFEVNDGDEDNLIADFGTPNAAVDIVTVDGTTFTGVSSGDTIDVEDVDSFTVTVTRSEGDIEEFVPVVFVADDEDEEALAVDADGVPGDDAEFGVGGTTSVVDPVLTSAFTARSAVIGDTVEVTVQVENGDGDPLEVAGIDIAVRYAEGAEDFDDVTTSNLIEEATITTDEDGQATFVAAGTGLDDDTATSVAFKWDGVDTLDGLEAELRSADITWFDGATDPEAVSIATTTELLGVGMSASVTATVVDDQDLPVSGATVELSGEAAERSDFTQTATTDADGVATFSYTNNVGADVDELSVTVTTDGDGDDLDDPVELPGGEEILVGWFAEANDDNDQVNPLEETGGEVQNVIGASSDLEVVFIGEVTATVTDTEDVQDRLEKLVNGGDLVDADAMLWVDYTDGDVFNIDNDTQVATDDNTALELFAAALFDNDGDFRDDNVLLFEAQDRANDDADTVYNVITDAGESTGYLLSGVFDAGASTVANATAANPGTVEASPNDVFGELITDIAQARFTATVDGGDELAIAGLAEDDDEYTLTLTEEVEATNPVEVFLDGTSLGTTNAP